jgi:hypothetical protein
VGASRERGVASVTVEVGSSDGMVEDVRMGALAWLGDANVLRLT